MGENTKIEWANHTFNPWIGCTKISPACDHCYAERLMDSRLGRVEWGAGKPRVRTSAENWKKPLKWDAAARKHKIRPRVFCASLADVFDNEVPDQWRFDLFDLIERTPNLDWLLLTKRIGNLRSASTMAPPPLAAQWPRNVWIGATVVTQEELDRDLPKLADVPARIRFLSVEPMLEPMTLRGLGALVAKLDWIIVGGESGEGARALNRDWAIALRRECDLAGIAFFFKQGSEQNWVRFREPSTFPVELRVRQVPLSPVRDFA